MFVIIAFASQTANALLRGKRLKPTTSKQNNNSPKLQNANRNPESACPLPLATCYIFLVSLTQNHEKSKQKRGTQNGKNKNPTDCTMIKTSETKNSHIAKTKFAPKLARTTARKCKIPLANQPKN